MLSNDELAALIDVGVESRSIEFKGPGSTSSTEFVAVVARACIALANQRDGGHVVIGVADNDPGGRNGGLDETQMAEWSNYDVVLAKVNAFADPPLGLAIGSRELPGGQQVIVIEVAEFAEIPILSAKEYSGKIVRGQLYTRSMAKPESSASNTQNELREVLALATEKQLQNFIRTARNAGLSTSGDPSDAEQFAAESAAFIAQPVASGVANEPQISTVIRPERYQMELLHFENLRPIVADNAVRLRGWPFPFVRNVVFGDRWAAEAQVETHPEVWGMHQSGQFIAVKPLPGGYGPDWDGFRDASTDGPYLPIWFPVAFIFESLLFASRLQKAIAASESLHARFAVDGAQGWELVTADPRRGGFHSSYRLGTEHWERTVAVEPGLIDDDLQRIAAETSRDLLLRFGWTGVTTDVIRGLQDEMFR
ncbi:MAG: ATP-binding protein [Microbacterium sp.]|uniref:AlbA family DNA-binding domain-containing protein n=1 Tax=Microbacterium sp. TaxID=51671 RepID=UPI002726ECF9|nr:ATP-binding protein [Microbacterium sp.]MDO8383363.1 ATP-binding protein [Microbacterium sp.]